ncbi:hypothetical protein AB0N07_36320 [Streptomyces sp. NPDC051172]|uniref:hypothetical protein n=1 Tax=Streptomyces sp. NPDC051172 TaxID=3155796 RepID=UPI0034268C1B
MAEPHPRATPEIIAEREALAKRVCRELERAGFPVYRGDLSGSPHTQAGVDVHVTPFTDGGVYVDWETAAELRDPALDLLAKGIDYSNPPVLARYYNTVLNQMQAALLEILASAGFEVVRPDPHGHGSMVQVTEYRR